MLGNVIAYKESTEDRSGDRKSPVTQVVWVEREVSVLLRRVDSTSTAPALILNLPQTNWVNLRVSLCLNSSIYKMGIIIVLAYLAELLQRLKEFI